MDWTAIISLIVSQGIPVAEKLWQLWASKAAPTQADWDQLTALGKVTARQEMLAALAVQGIDPTSPQGQAFLALTP
jgi:hypothetical protein